MDTCHEARLKRTLRFRSYARTWNRPALTKLRIALRSGYLFVYNDVCVEEEKITIAEERKEGHMSQLTARW